MIDIFLSGAKSFRVHYHNIYHLILLVFVNQWFSPDPNPLGFRVSGRANCKSSLLFEHDGVEKIGLASSIHTCHRNDGYFSLDGLEEVESFRVGFVFSYTWLSLALLTEYQWNCFFLVFFHLNFILECSKTKINRVDICVGYQNGHLNTVLMKCKSNY